MPTTTPQPAHRSRAYIHAPQDAGARLADQVALAVGSWRFVIGQSALMTVWIVLNTVGWFLHWDSYPFVFLNLAMSAEAAFATPIILMSQNRQAAKDRLRDDHEAQEVDALMTLNEQQLEILRLLHQLAAQPAAKTTLPMPRTPAPAPAHTRRRQAKAKPKRTRTRTPRR